MSQQWIYFIAIVLHNKDRIESGNYRGSSLVAHAGKILLKIIARRLSEYCERVGILPQEQSGFRPTCSTSDNDVCDLPARVVGADVCIFIDLTKSYDSVDHTPSGQYSPVLTYHRI